MSNHPRPPPLRRIVGQHLLFLAIVAAPMLLLMHDEYWMDVLTYTYLFAAVASAWNIIGGFGGQFSMGHGVFFAVGAYAVARPYVGAGVSPWLTLPVAALLGAIVSAAVSLPTFRLRGPFFAIATMAINEVGLVLANFMEYVTGGPRGLLIPYRESFAAMIFADRWMYALLMFAFLTLTTLITLAIRRGRLGHNLIALRSNDAAASATGVDVLKTKLTGMAISAALTAVGGGLFAMYVRMIDPPALFSLPEIGVKFALIALIGGIGTVQGPIIGAFVIVPLEFVLRAQFSDSVLGGHLIIMSILLILAARFFKQGIFGAFKPSFTR
jgi:branched-chain amino acid transport system permease protein